MKIKIEDSNILIYINKQMINFDYLSKPKLEEYIKSLILKIRKKYDLNISGYYKVNVYQNNILGVFFNIIKLDELDFFPDLIDLKVTLFYDENIFLSLDDYFLLNKYKNVYYYKNKFYIDVSELSSNDLICLTEFGEYIYGEFKNKLIKKFKKVTFDSKELLC